MAHVGPLPRVCTLVLLQVFTVREGLVAGLAGELRVGGASAILEVTPEPGAGVEDAAADGAGQHLHPVKQIHGSYAAPLYHPSHVQPDHPSRSPDCIQHHIRLLLRVREGVGLSRLRLVVDLVVMVVVVATDVLREA